MLGIGFGLGALRGSAAGFSGLYALDFTGQQDNLNGNFTAGTGFTGGDKQDLVRTPWTFTRATVKYVETVDDDGAGNFVTTWKQIPSGMLPLNGFSVRETGFGGFGVADWGYSTVTETSGLTIPVDATRGATDTGTWGRQGYVPEPARTNLIEYSYDLTNTGWTGPNGGTGTESLTAVGITGSSNTATIVADTDGSNVVNWRNSVSISASTDPVSLIVFVKKDSDTTRFVGIELFMSGGTAFDAELHLNTATGAATERFGTFDSYVVEQIGDWWAITLTATNANNSLADILFKPASGTVFGTQSVAATGSCIVGHVEINDSASTRTSPIITNGSTATRNEDVFAASGLTLDIPFSVVADAVSNPRDGTLILGELVATVDEDRVTLGDTNASSAVEVQAFIENGNSTQANLKVSPGQSAFVQALRCAADDAAMSVNGSAVETDSSLALTTMTNAYLGYRHPSSGGAQQVWNSAIRSFKIYDRGLTDTQLISESS